mmetsp:Transcript_23179/g.53318  ORF Transcript_23179/g.53318 Transcript_23179/m.53318 type:complete len:130 (+) Transcript_23179:1884-2273(+)
MLQVIRTDFERTVTATSKAQAAATKEFMTFMTKTGMALAQHVEAAKAQKLQKNGAEESLAEAQEKLKSQTSILSTALSELLELKPQCVTGMSYEERVGRREDEIAALQKAECIFEKYEEHGPEGGAAEC